MIGSSISRENEKFTERSYNYSRKESILVLEILVVNSNGIKRSRNTEEKPSNVGLRVALLTSRLATMR